MDEPTALLPPVSTSSLAELLEAGPLPLTKGLELLGIIAGHVARLHANARTHGLLTAQHIRVQIFESGPPVVIFLEPETTRDMTEGADQLALGVLAFQVLAGRPPRADEALHDALPGVAPVLDRLVSKLLAPRPADRLPASGAQRQLLDLAASLSDPASKPVSPLAAPPQIKRGVPIGEQNTDAHAWVRPGSPSKAPRSQEPNPFADDEATAMVDSPRPSPDARHGPAMDDEPTQFEPVPRPKRPRPTERAEPPLAPPVPTPAPQPAFDETRDGFEPSRSDLPGNTADELSDPRLAPARPAPRRHSPGEHSPRSELLQLAKRQPPWVWGAVGVGLAFFVLLLIALTR